MINSLSKSDHNENVMQCLPFPPLASLQCLSCVFNMVILDSVRLRFIPLFVLREIETCEKLVSVLFSGVTAYAQRTRDTLIFMGPIIFTALTLILQLSEILLLFYLCQSTYCKYNRTNKQIQIQQKSGSDKAVFSE